MAEYITNIYMTFRDDLTILAKIQKEQKDKLKYIYGDERNTETIDVTLIVNDGRRFIFEEI